MDDDMRDAGYEPLSTAKISAEDGVLQGLRIIVVDDDDDARLSLATVLDLYGADALSAANAQEALELLRRSPDVLVSDIGMPGEDGNSLIRRIRKREAQAGRGEHLAAIAVSAYTRPEDRAAALLAGFDAHVSKPADPRQLAETIRNLVAARRAASSRRQLASAPAPRRDSVKLTRPAVKADESGIAHGAWLAIIGFAVLVVALQGAQEFLIPLVLGGVLSYALEPVVRGLVRVRVPRPLAAALVLLAAVGSIGAGIYKLSDEALAVASRLPVAARQLRQKLQRTNNITPVQAVGALADEIDKGAAAATSAAQPPAGVVRVQVEEKPFDLRSMLWQGSLGAVALGTNGVLLLFLTYFLMASGDMFHRKIVSLVGTSPERRQMTVEVLEEISHQVQSFLFIQLVTGVVVGVASWAAFRLLGLENAAVWGVAAGVFNTIPYFGPLIVMAGLFVAATLQFGSLSMVLAVVASSLVVTGLEGFVLRPLLVGRAAAMNEVAVFVSLLFWGWMWGVVGMLLAVPLMMFVKSICDRVEGLAPIGVLLGDESQQGPACPEA